MARPHRPKSSQTPGLPSREALLGFIRESGQTDKNEIAKAFGLKGGDRRALRDLLKSLEEDGALGKRGRRGLAEAGSLPPVGVADVVERMAAVAALNALWGGM